MTAKSARKSPSRLTSCAIQTRRITRSCRTSRKVIGTGGAPGAAAGVVMRRGRDYIAAFVACWPVETEDQGRRSRRSRRERDDLSTRRHGESENGGRLGGSGCGRRPDG